MAIEYREPRIPGSYHSFKRLIERLLEEDPNASRKELKRRIKNMTGLPPEHDGPFWDELETSCLGASRTRRHLFDDRFNLAMHRIRNGWLGMDFAETVVEPLAFSLLTAYSGNLHARLCPVSA